MRDGDSLARRWLTTTEHEEAVMKATGLGLSLDPTSFEVPGGALLHEPAPVGIGLPETGRLQLMDIMSGSWPVGLLGSVCVDVSRQATAS